MGEAYKRQLSVVGETSQTGQGMVERVVAFYGWCIKAHNIV